MSNGKMSPEMQIAIRRSPDYTAPSTELVALRAEVAAWRRAIRWRTAFDGSGMHVMSIGTRDVVAAYAPYCAVRQNKSDIPAFLREHGLPDIGLGE